MERSSRSTATRALWSGHFAKRARFALKNDHFVRRKCEYGAGNDGEKREKKKRKKRKSLEKNVTGMGERVPMSGYCHRRLRDALK